MMSSRRRVARDLCLFGAGCAGLLLLFSRAAATHTTGAAWIGLILCALAAVGAMGLLGDSPLDLRGDEAAAPQPAPRAPWSRAIVAALAVVYLASAGAFGLWDPWETHYAEVGREMLSRDDWITLWWGPEGWFLSKPALLPALIALGISAATPFGAQFSPGVHGHAIEWAVRLPLALLSLAAVWSLAQTTAQLWGRRAGALAGLVLATTPFWVLVSHQAMTDLPFVSLLTIAMMALARAVTCDPSARTNAHVFKLVRHPIRWSKWHSTVGLLLLIALPQSLYLSSRPVVLRCDDGDPACVAAAARSRAGAAQLPFERFYAGSAENSVSASEIPVVPGAPAWTAHYSSAPVPSAAQGAAWLLLLALVLRSLRRERSTQALEFTQVYLFAGLSFLAKGPAGVGLPELVLALFLLANRRWALLRQLRLVRGITVFALVGLPWYVAITCRLGRTFIDRFVVHDLIARTVSGVHGEQGALGYYVHQLVAGLFPWGALLLLGLFAPPSTRQSPSKRALLSIVRLWFALSFVLFSVMATRFHHYIFPAVPAAAILIGLTLDAWIDDERAPRPLSKLAPWIVAAITAVSTVELARAPQRFVHLFTYNYERPIAASTQGHGLVWALVGASATIALLYASAANLRRRAVTLLMITALGASGWLMFRWYPSLSVHRSQRALFDRILRERSDPSTPIAAYALNWKGENFYSGGSIAQFECGFAACPQGAFAPWLQAQRGQRALVLTEHSRAATVTALAARAGRSTRTVTSTVENQYFVVIEVGP